MKNGCLKLYKWWMVVALMITSNISIRAQATLDEVEIAERIMERKNVSGYKEGTRWTNEKKYVNTVEFNGYPAGYFTGYGCWGFMLDMMEYASNYEYPIRVIEGTYDNLPEIHVGDGVRLNYDTHSVVVIERNDYNNVVTVVEGNYNSSVHWGRKIDLANPSNGFTNIATFWPEDDDNISDIANQSNRNICIYSLSGMLVKSFSQTDLPIKTILQELPHGTYVVKEGKRIYKIMR